MSSAEEPQPTVDVSIATIRERMGTKPMPPEQFEEVFGELPTDGEG